MVKVIHKRVTTSTRCSSFSFQMCDKKNNSNVYPDGAWIKSTHYKWNEVTCSECLNLKGIPYKKKKRKIVIYDGF